MWLHSSVGRASHRYFAEVTGLNPVEALIFSGFFFTRKPSPGIAERNADESNIVSIVDESEELIYHLKIRSQLILFGGSCVISVIRLASLCSQFL